jgi:hypothetical protein
MHRSNVHRSKECTMECGQITLCIPTEHCTFNIPVQVTFLYSLHFTAHCAFQQNIVHLTFLYRSQSCTIYILQHIVHSNRALYISCTCHIPVHFTFYSTLCIPTETDHRKRGQIKGMYNVHRCAQIKGLCTSARPP